MIEGKNDWTLNASVLFEGHLEDYTLKKGMAVKTNKDARALTKSTQKRYGLPEVFRSTPYSMVKSELI